MAVTADKYQLQLKLLLFFRNDLAGSIPYRCHTVLGIAGWFDLDLALRFHRLRFSLLGFAFFLFLPAKCD